MHSNWLLRYVKCDDVLLWLLIFVTIKEKMSLTVIVISNLRQSSWNVFSLKKKPFYSFHLLKVSPLQKKNNYVSFLKLSLYECFIDVCNNYFSGSNFVTFENRGHMMLIDFKVTAVNFPKNLCFRGDIVRCKW